jgi:hypothetical protein
MKKMAPEMLMEQACSAFRARDRWGRILPSPAWMDLAPDVCEEVYKLQLETREFERALDPDGLSGTVRCIKLRVTHDE